jgi:uncharacterized protein with predicted RNA binding PUA domain
MGESEFLSSLSYLCVVILNEFKCRVCRSFHGFSLNHYGKNGNPRFCRLHLRFCLFFPNHFSMFGAFSADSEFSTFDDDFEGLTEDLAPANFTSQCVRTLLGFIIRRVYTCRIVVTLLRRNKRSNASLVRVRSVADYQFGKHVGTKLFPRKVEISYSERTGRIRYVRLDGIRLATLRPTDGLFSLSIDGAKRLLEFSEQKLKCLVSVRSDVSEFIRKSGDVFATHVVGASDEIRSKDEVIVVNEHGALLAIGRAMLSGSEMKAFKRGIAVKVRRGFLEET